MWKITRGLLSEKRIDIAVVGVGGTGSHFVSHAINLHLGLKALGYGGLNLYAFDNDSVSESNVVRQRYTQADIGLNKAIVLIERCNLAYPELAWKAIPIKFSGEYAALNWDIVVSCVDTRAARHEIHDSAFNRKKGFFKYLVDLGNFSDGGQVVIGSPGRRSKGRRFLPCAAELHPEIADSSIPEDNTPSCSALESLQRQDLFINATVALHAADMLWQLFRKKQLTTNARYFNLPTSTLAARVA